MDANGSSKRLLWAGNRTLIYTIFMLDFHFLPHNERIAKDLNAKI